MTAAGATASAAGYLFRDGGVLSAQGAVERLITLAVNGRQRRVDVPRHETLAMTLRYQAGEAVGVGGGVGRKGRPAPGDRA